jgi:hypothetical protein
MQRQAHSFLARTGKTILCMIFIGLVCAFIAANLYSVGRRVGLSPSTAEQLPNYAFSFGLVLGLSIRTIQSVKYIFSCLVAMAVVGAIFWFIGAVLEAILVTCGLNPDIASWISPIAFWLGVLLGSFTLYAYVREMADSLFERLKSNFSGS